MSLKSRLDERFDVSSYGYKVNKWILRFAFFLMVVLFLVVVRVDGWSVAVYGSQFVSCDDVLGCLNPYELDSFGEPTVLRGGESFGVEGSGLARSFPLIALGLFVFSLLLNHLLYNKSFRVKKC